jgi:hypothetical protein
MLPPAASEFYRAQQRLIVATLAATRSVWARMDEADLDGSWRRVGPVLTAVVSSAQEGAARNGSAYVGAALAQQDTPVEPVARVQPAAFAGYAADGRGLTSLLEGAKVYAKTSQSMTAAATWLDMVAHTAVQDAGRQAAGVDMFTRPRVGWVRAVNPPCCQRCAVLAGRFERSHEAFPRHPRCDCFAVPSTEGGEHPGVVIGPEDVKDLTEAQRQAISDGADMNQVINAHRANARSANRLYTTEGATRRGVAGKRLGAAKGKRAARLTPEGIYRMAAGNRDEALRLLRLHGYII